MINEELHKQAIDCFNQYIELQEQAEKDYNNVKTIIEQSDKILEKYEQRYNKQIASKDEEIRLLEKELEKLKTETENYNKMLQNIPSKVREKYVKRRIY